MSSKFSKLFHRNKKDKNGKRLSEIKVMAIGDMNSNKKGVLIDYIKKTWEDGPPIAIETFDLTVELDDKQSVTMHIWDPIASDALDEIRPFCYDKTNIFVIFFALNKRTSFEQVKSKLVPEIKDNCPDVKYLLVGTIIWEKEKNEGNCVTETEGQNLAKEIGAIEYIEIVIESQKNMKYLFDKIAFYGSLE